MPIGITVSLLICRLASGFRLRRASFTGCTSGPRCRGVWFGGFFDKVASKSEATWRFQPDTRQKTEQGQPHNGKSQKNQRRGGCSCQSSYGPQVYLNPLPPPPISQRARRERAMLHSQAELPNEGVQRKPCGRQSRYVNLIRSLAFCPAQVQLCCAARKGAHGTWDVGMCVGFQGFQKSGI